MMGAGLSSRPAHQRRRIKSFGEEQEFRKYILSVSHDVHKNGEAEPTFNLILIFHVVRIDIVGCLG